MAEEILDGTGSGTRMKVGKDNRAFVNAVSHTSEEVHTFNGESFLIHAECHMAANTDGGLLAFKYTGNKRINIVSLFLDSLILTKDMKIVVVKNPTIASGTVDVANVIQRNGFRTAELDQQVTISDGSSDLTFTGGEELISFGIQTLQSKDRSPKGAFMMKKNDILLIGWEAFTGNGIDGELISIALGVYEFVDEDFE